MHTSTRRFLHFAYAVGLATMQISWAEVVVPINLITVIVGNNPLTGYETASAAYDVALDKAREMYPKVFQNFTRTWHTTPGNFTCTQAAGEMVILMSSVYSQVMAHRSQGIRSVLLTPGKLRYEEFLSRCWFNVGNFGPDCSLEVLQLGDFCRELGSPLIASVAADHDFADKRRFPTLIAMGPSGFFSMFDALVALLKQYSWSSLSIICDIRSHDLLNKGPVLFCKTARENFALMRNIDALFIPMDSSVDKEFNIMQIMDVAKKHSAVTMLASNPDVQTELMAQAADMDMDDGRYVFLLLGTPERSFHYDHLWTLQDPLTLKAISVLPYSIKLSTVLPAKKDVRAEVYAMTARLTGYYKQKVESRSKFNINQIAAFHSVLILSQILNDSYENLSKMDATTFVSLFLNKTFELPSHQRLVISKHGLQIANIVLSQYDFEREDYDVVHHYDAKASNLIFAPKKSIQWPYGMALPLSSDPPCGRNGRLCTYKDPDNSFFSLFLLLGVAGGTIFIIRRIVLKCRGTWWKIDDSEIMRNIQEPKSILLAGHRINFSICSCSCRPSQSTIKTIEKVFYKGQAMTAIRFSTAITIRPQDVLQHDKVPDVLHMIKALDHPNIGKFYGMAFTQSILQNEFSAVLTECGAKGLLRELIDNDVLSFSWDLRFSMIWDLIKGLRYLHSDSSLGAHGCLNFLNCVVDQHFTLKITLSGLCKLYTSLLGSSFIMQVPAVCFLWLAPEMLINPEQIPTIGGDIYSLGVILYEIASRKAPFDVDITNNSNIHDMLETIRNGELNPNAYLDPDETQPLLIDMIRSCWSLNRFRRPTIASIITTLVHVHPENNVTFAENVISRLQHYNEELESVVCTRTKELQAERHKVDYLLSLVLPESIAVKLRSKITVAPQYFESVSVLFSDIPAFNEIVTKCPPFAVVDLLHCLYSALDEAISKYDVFKVETIKDSYMVSSGLPNINGNRHVAEIARTGLEMLHTASQIRSPFWLHEEFLRLRIGIHSGPCVGTVIGLKLPHYCLVGDTVNTASRLETSGEESKIHISSETKQMLDNFYAAVFLTEERGVIDIKGKGQLLTHWLLQEKT